MRELEAPFTISDGDAVIQVSEHELKEMRLFHLVFPDKRKPLNITVAERRGTGEKFWTSVPEGRQDEAEQFGRLIAVYIRSKRKT
ncbi:hypothetical protein FO440_09580 [Mucilaginibacter corticis]|uniref:Uncharacterized protein n=1 Tax=Mucilaginibacter corticis TaxID=2597670 RepID=A0A556MX79_9SPHI|nr:hypothetical protein [Mucilaginibacter corticis]TSJ44409.1 hypothetical protein FO440_09580 [Mucilaginibacter corticis]